MATQWTAERLRKEIAIKCDNLEQRKQVFDKVESMGFKLWDDKANKIDGLYVITCNDGDYILSSDCLGNVPILASNFLNDTPPNPELIELKKRLLEIADNVGGEYTKEVQYFTALHQYINLDNETICTALANLIINSDI